MIRIQNSADIEDEFFCGCDFGLPIESVKNVLEAVRLRGDEAVREFSIKFDSLAPENFEIPMEVLEKSSMKMQSENPTLYDSLLYSRDMAMRFAKIQCECFTDFERELEPGLFTGQRNLAVNRAGAYVPAGRFPLVSTVVMTVVPAVAAGVKEIMLCTAPRKNPDGSNSAYADENIMAAAHVCGVTKAFAIGGSQAIGAMAFGTQSIPKADVIVGPGNKFVQEAKRLVYGIVGIDMIAGPTETFIIADESANPVWLAADLLAQAEHDIAAQPILAVLSETQAKEVAEEIERQLESLPTKEVARASVDNRGRIIVCTSLEEAAEISNKKAPEHLELAMTEGVERDRIESLIRNFGSLFIGHGAAEVLGDYASGLNHTLPTSGSAKFTGGLSVRSFIKTVTTLRADMNMAGARNSAVAAGHLGDAEGLAAHARASRLRLGENS